MNASGRTAALVGALLTAASGGTPEEIRRALHETDSGEQKKRLVAFHTRLSEERRQRAEYAAYNAAVQTRQVRRARERERLRCSAPGV